MIYTYKNVGEEPVWVSEDGKRSAIAACGNERDMFLYTYRGNGLPKVLRGFVASAELINSMLDKGIQPNIGQVQTIRKQVGRTKDISKALRFVETGELDV